jgi:hypothetical protein
LQRKAEQGSEVALAVLRSRGETVEPEREAAPGREQFHSGRAEYAGKERALLEREDLSAWSKTRLLAVVRMESLAGEAGIAGFRHRVDHKGAVIFSLPGGGAIRDEGKELFFTAQDETARRVALAYARKKWGRSVHLEGNRICLEPGKERQRGVDLSERAKDQGLSR